MLSTPIEANPTIDQPLTIAILNNSIMKKISIVTKLVSFNPTNLLSRTLRHRKLLKNPDVLSMIHTAYTWGKNSEANKLYGNPPGPDPFTLENLLEELKK